MRNIDKYSQDIIELLKDEGITVNIQLQNTIKLIVFKAYEEGKEFGIKEGVKLGIKQACQEIENKVSSLKSNI